MTNIIKPITTNSSPIKLSNKKVGLTLVVEERGNEVEFINSSGSDISKLIDQKDIVISSKTLSEWLELFRSNSIFTKYVIKSGAIVIRVADMYQLSTDDLKQIIYSDELDNRLVKYDTGDEVCNVLYAGDVNELVTPNYEFNEVKDKLIEVNNQLNSMEFVPRLPSYSKKVNNILPINHISDYVSFENNLDESGNRVVKPGNTVDITIGYCDSNVGMNLVKWDDKSCKYDDMFILYGGLGIHNLSGTIVVPEEGQVYRKNMNGLLLEITSDRLVMYSTNPKIKEYLIKSCRVYDN